MPAGGRKALPEGLSLLGSLVGPHPPPIPPGQIRAMLTSPTGLTTLWPNVAGEQL